MFREVRWAKRKHRARNTQQEDRKKGWRDVHSMEKPQHLFTQGLDKNITLGGGGTGSTGLYTRKKALIRHRFYRHADLGLKGPPEL